MGFSGTFLTQGTARAIVVDTGAGTVFGQIADMVKAADKDDALQQRKMKEFVKTSSSPSWIVGAFNFGYGCTVGHDIAFYSFLGAVSWSLLPYPRCCRHW